MGATKIFAWTDFDIRTSDILFVPLRMAQIPLIPAHIPFDRRQQIVYIHKNHKPINKSIAGFR
jgi:hypothetical protein